MYLYKVTIGYNLIYIYVYTIPSLFYIKPQRVKRVVCAEISIENNNENTVNTQKKSCTWFP